MRHQLSFFIASLIAVSGLFALRTFLPTTQQQPAIKTQQSTFVCELCKRPTALNNAQTYAPQAGKSAHRNFRRVITRITPGRYLPTIETDRIILREFMSADEEAVFAYGSQPETVQSMTFKRHTSRAHTRKVMNRWFDGYKKGTETRWALVSKAHGGVVGCANIHTYAWHDRRALLGYTLNSDEWGKGYATQAARALVEFGFEHLGLENIGAVIRVDNVGSMRVMEKTGASATVTTRKYWHVNGETLLMYHFEILKRNVRDLLAKGA